MEGRPQGYGKHLERSRMRGLNIHIPEHKLKRQGNAHMQDNILPSIYTYHQGQPERIDAVKSELKTFCIQYIQNSHKEFVYNVYKMSMMYKQEGY